MDEQGTSDLVSLEIKHPGIYKIVASQAKQEANTHLSSSFYQDGWGLWIMGDLNGYFHMKEEKVLVNP